MKTKLAFAATIAAVFMSSAVFAGGEEDKGKGYSPPPKPNPLPTQPIHIDNRDEIDVDVTLRASAEAEAHAAALAAQQQQQALINQNEFNATLDLGGLIEEGAIQVEVPLTVEGDTITVPVVVHDGNVTTTVTTPVNVDVDVDEAPTNVTVEGDKNLNLVPHIPFVNGIPTPQLYEHKMSASGTSVPFLIDLMRLAPPTFSASRDMRPRVEDGPSGLSTVTFLPYRSDVPVRRRETGEATVAVLEISGHEGEQRFRVLGRVSAEAAPKRADKAFFDTLVSDAAIFTSKSIRNAQASLLFDQCTVSINNVVRTFGRGSGASGGLSQVNDLFSTITGGVSLGSGLTMNISQVGVTFVIVEPTDDTGTDTFSLSDIKQSTSQAASETPAGEDSGS